MMQYEILGLGVDLVGVDRVERAVARHGGEFLEEFLQTSETAACFRSLRPLTRCASLFAAKEAFYKALGTGKSGPLRWTDVEVRPEDWKSPRLSLTGEADTAARALGVRRVHLQFAFPGRRARPEVVAAMVVLEGQARTPDAQTVRPAAEKAGRTCGAEGSREAGLGAGGL
jgi:holo-[acyl-carrier protein] synthase